MGLHMNGKAPVKANYSAWITGIGSLLTIILTLYNAITTQQIEEQKLALELEQNKLEQIKVDISKIEIKSQIALEEARENFTRYEFVHKLMPTLLSEKKEQRTFTRNLIIVALREEEAQKLFEGLFLSNDPVAKEEGTSGLETLREKREKQRNLIKKLSQELNHQDRDIRNLALQELISNYSKETDTIDNVLTWLMEDNINKLSLQGRVNVLYVLAFTDPSAWTPELIDAANEAIKRIDNLSPELGPQARSFLNEFVKHLKKIEGQFSSKY